MMVKEERVLKGKKIISIRKHDSSVFHHIDVFWRPSCCNIGHDSLLKKGPVAREANKKGSGLIDVRSGRNIPWRD